ncbi:hypothetical protein HK104_006503 [Borealophlyctis nickersoniae]|nr:hypothetical protein HK104_006503 [Borealophlyctis nickersoniae]
MRSAFFVAGLGALALSSGIVHGSDKRVIKQYLGIKYLRDFGSRVGQRDLQNLLRKRMQELYARRDDPGWGVQGYIECGHQ